MQSLFRLDSWRNFPKDVLSGHNILQYKWILSHHEFTFAQKSIVLPQKAKLSGCCAHPCYQYVPFL